MSNEEIKPRYKQNRRLKQAKLQRQIRKSQRRLTRLRAFYKIFLVLGTIALCFFILKMPQWRLSPDAFDSLNSSSLEIVNNRIVPSQKILCKLAKSI